MKNKIIVLDGIIAAGKTYTLHQIEKYSHLDKVLEPIDEYTHFVGSKKIFNPLKLYYANPKQNAACTQLHIIDCLEKLTKERLFCPVTLIERYFTSVQSFTQTMLDNDFISEFSAAFVSQKLSEALSRVNDYCQIEKIIFLDTEVDVCLKRWRNRERNEEMSFSSHDMKNYLTQLRANFLEFYSKHYSSELVIVANNDMGLIRKTVRNVLGEGAAAVVQ